MARTTFCKEPPLELYGDAYARNFRDDDEDYFTQPGDLFRIIKADGKENALFKHRRKRGWS